MYPAHCGEVVGVHTLDVASANVVWVKAIKIADVLDDVIVDCVAKLFNLCTCGSFNSVVAEELGEPLQLDVASHAVLCFQHDDVFEIAPGATSKALCHCFGVACEGEIRCSVVVSVEHTVLTRSGVVRAAACRKK